MAIDLGSSMGKCFYSEIRNKKLVFEEINRFENEPVALFLKEKDESRVERLFWNDIYLYRNILNSFRIYSREFGGTLDSIGIDTWGLDGQFVNKNGELIGNIYCYRDHRLDNMIDKLTKKVDAKKIYEITGVHFQPFNISNQFLWFLQNRKYILEISARFLPLPTIFNYFLGSEYVVDSTWASATQLMNIRTNDWSQELLEQLEIPIEILPQIVNPGTQIGVLAAPIAASIGLNRARIVAVCSHDTASAFTAVPIKNKDDSLIISSGTWSVIGKLISSPITTHEAFTANFSNEGNQSSTSFLKNCMGLWIVQELRRSWRERDGQAISWAQAVRMIRKARPFTAVIDPDAQSFYNPKNMEEAIAHYCRKTRQTVPNDRGTYLRIVLESLALKYRVINDEIESITNNHNKYVFIVGGGSRNELLNQFAANALGIPVYAGPAEASALGNIFSQAIALGILKTKEEMNTIVEDTCAIRKYTPKNTTLWSTKYRAFLRVISTYDEP